MSSEVVVTGMGMTTPVGGDVESNWEAILAGRPGISVIDQTWVADQPAKIAGLLAVEPGTILEKHETPLFPSPFHPPIPFSARPLVSFPIPPETVSIN